MPSFHFNDHDSVAICDNEGRDTQRARPALLGVLLRGGVIGAMPCAGWIELDRIGERQKVRICNVRAWSVKCTAGQVGTEFTTPGTQVLGVIDGGAVRVVHSSGWPIILPSKSASQHASLQTLYEQSFG